MNHYMRVMRNLRDEFADLYRNAGSDPLIYLACLYIGKRAHASLKGHRLDSILSNANADIPPDPEKILARGRFLLSPRITDAAATGFQFSVIGEGPGLKEQLDARIIPAFVQLARRIPGTLIHDVAVGGEAEVWPLWLDFVYRLAIDNPGALGYSSLMGVYEWAETPREESEATTVGGRYSDPRTPHALTRWQAGEGGIVHEVHQFWLEPDIRKCTIEAIDFLLDQAEAEASPKLVDMATSPRSIQSDAKKIALDAPTLPAIEIVAQYGPVRLDADGRTAYVWDKRFNLTEGQFRAVAALVHASDRGIHDSFLPDKAGESAKDQLGGLMGRRKRAPRRYFDPYWKAVIGMRPWRIIADAEKPHGKGVKKA